MEMSLSYVSETPRVRLLNRILSKASDYEAKSIYADGSRDSGYQRAAAFYLEVACCVEAANEESIKDILVRAGLYQELMEYLGNYYY